MSTTRWASCSREVNPVVAEYRHIVRRGALTTACGATASTPDVWRGNRNKPKCPTCLKAAVVIGSPRPERRPPMTDTTPAGGTEHPGCTEPRRPPAPTRPSSTSAGAGRPNPPVPAEGTEGHEHDWVDATATGARVAAYCDVWGCTATKPRPTPPVPAAEDDAARAEAERRYTEKVAGTDCLSSRAQHDRKVFLDLNRPRMVEAFRAAGLTVVDGPTEGGA